MIDPGPDTLPALEARLARDFAVLNQPLANWVTPREHPEHGPVLDVAIIGAGMAGLTAAAALIRDGIPNIRLFDANPEGFEGPWVTFARMETLRSPKHLTGPALGIPSLTFRAWFEAQFGRAEWDALWRIPRTQWMDYLRWYRRVLNLPVQNDIRMTGLEPEADLIRLSFDNGQTTAARRVILATGRDGLGGPIMPATFAPLPATHCVHSSADIDFAGLRGKTVGVIGVGASAFDNAGTALEAGAASVTMLFRRADIPRINKGLGVNSPGMNAGYYDLPPERRLAITSYIAETGSTPPRLSIIRCTRHPNFHWASSCPVRAARMDGNQAVLDTPRGDMRFDFVIVATGFGTDMTRRPELTHLAAAAQRWDEAHPPVAQLGADYGASPFLGEHMQFLPRTPSDEWVQRIYCLNFAGTLSHYKLTGDIPAISDGAQRITNGITRAFFTEDYEDHFQRLLDFQTPEVQGDEWTEETLLPVLENSPLP
jgi:cation diffusion facilitator CzcD-associated flavoprotein CzcO